MTWVVLLGWVAAAVAAFLGLPQVVRIVRTRDTAGVAQITWQAMLGAGLGWLGHGIQIGSPPQITANAVGAIWTTTVLVLLIRARGANPPRVIGPSLLIAAVLVLTDALFGTTVFGLVMIVPTILANLAQTVALIRAPRVDGVSPVYLVASITTQALWAVWGVLVGDAGTVVGSAAGALIVLFNLVWWVLRRRGLRPCRLRSELSWHRLVGA